MDERIIARFWSRVDKRGSDECWPWIHTRNKKGYGSFWAGDRNIQAHRFSALLHGIPLGNLQCAHKCHNPACCNPNHFYAATCQRNVADSVAAGRRSHLVGASHNRAILTEADAFEILRLHREGLGALRLSRRFGVCKATISHLLTGRNWKNLPRE
jgi:hypothetical protein